MSRLIPVIYRNINFPSKIKANIHEVAGNFDVEKLSVDVPYSLHTEYSYGGREFNSKIIKDLKHITKAQKNKIPQLWYNKEWAKDFFKFIKRIIGSNKPPEVLEIHPPFNDYCDTFDQFLKTFNVFYEKFNKKYPTTKILIENRFGTRYKGGKFLLSTCCDILEFCKVLKREKINLKIVLDYPQLFSAEINEDKLKMDDIKLEKEKIISFNLELKKYKALIGGLHMWGKIKNGNVWTPHAGNFNTFFSNNKKLKKEFLSSVSSTFNDRIARYFVPEINSGQKDLHSIVADMESAKFIFH